MSSVWFTLITFSILSCTAALSDQGGGSSSSSVGGVTWRTRGTSVTITCSRPETLRDPLDSLSLKKGLHEKVQVFNLYKSGKVTVKEELQARLTTSGQMGRLDVTVSDLTPADTGLYECLYDTFDTKTMDIIETNGGSVLLVVEKAEAMPCEARPSDPGSSQTVLLVVCAVLGSVLLICLMALSMWAIPRVKSYFSSFSPETRQRVNTNDVYEDMRSTVRRRDDRPVRGQHQPLAQHP